ncbi:sugar ABC transporter permease [Cutibacterium avidum]|nr:sugar ABC transporter permease [Propionibacterium sp.]MCO6633776.1 sugar ABC transporter permease [Cutibacterium avidum]MBS6331357.1 sugar ABC transporter permease [Propionibacterium sp.]MCO6658072.1 sugar ABC transporter permease [Cutibacterium avidum]MCO6669776.1 sugar ABC transporter permease [Cutibacterium avidum]
MRRPRPAHRSDLSLALRFIAPASIGLIVFLIWPLITGIYYSFTSYDVLTPPRWTGLDNYRALIADDRFWNSLKVTVEYVAINIGVQTILAVLIAALMHRLTKSTVVRSLILSPYLVSNVVTALTFLWMLDIQFGIVNQLIVKLGGEAIGFWSDPKWVIPTIALVNVWRNMGYTALLIFAGLQGIPENLYEAGRTDGASEVSMFFRITMPLLRPILALVLIMTIIGSFQVFDTVAVSTTGGPADASNVLQMYIYQKAFGEYDFGYASALSVALLIILVIITAIQYKLTRAGQTDLN